MVIYNSELDRGAITHHLSANLILPNLFRDLRLWAPVHVINIRMTPVPVCLSNHYARSRSAAVEEM